MSCRRTAHRLFYVLVVVDDVLRRAPRGRPAPIHQNLSAMRLVFSKIGVTCIDGSHLSICVREVAIIVEGAPIPVWIVEDEVLPEVSSCRFGLAQYIVLPASVVAARQTFTAWRPASDNLLAGARILWSRIDLLDRFNLCSCQAILVILSMAQEGPGIEVTLKWICDDPIFQSIVLIAGRNRRLVY